MRARTELTAGHPARFGNAYMKNHDAVLGHLGTLGAYLWGKPETSGVLGQPVTAMHQPMERAGGVQWSARGQDSVDWGDVLRSPPKARELTGQPKAGTRGPALSGIPGFMNFVIPPGFVNQVLTLRAFGARGQVFEVVFELFLRAVCNTSQPTGPVSAPPPRG